MPELSVTHTNGDARDLRIVRAHPNYRLDLHWPLAGVYALDVCRGTLYGAQGWRATNIRDARRIWMGMAHPGVAPIVADSQTLPPIGECFITRRPVAGCVCRVCRYARSAWRAVPAPKVALAGELTDGALARVCERRACGQGPRPDLAPAGDLTDEALARVCERRA